MQSILIKEKMSSIFSYIFSFNFLLSLSSLLFNFSFIKFSHELNISLNSSQLNIFLYWYKISLYSSIFFSMYLNIVTKNEMTKFKS